MQNHPTVNVEIRRIDLCSERLTVTVKRFRNFEKHCCRLWPLFTNTTICQSICHPRFRFGTDFSPIDPICSAERQREAEDRCTPTTIVYYKRAHDWFGHRSCVAVLNRFPYSNSSIEQYRSCSFTELSAYDVEYVTNAQSTAMCEVLQLQS